MSFLIALQRIASTLLPYFLTRTLTRIPWFGTPLEATRVSSMSSFLSNRYLFLHILTPRYPFIPSRYSLSKIVTHKTFISLLPFSIGTEMSTLKGFPLFLGYLRVMNFRMLSMCLTQFKVLNSVIGSIMIYMMHCLSLFQRSSEVFFHDVAVLKDVSPMDSYSVVILPSYS